VWFTLVSLFLCSLPIKRKRNNIIHGAFSWNGTNMYGFYITLQHFYHEKHKIFSCYINDYIKTADTVTTGIHRVGRHCCHDIDSSQEPMGSCSTLIQKIITSSNFYYVSTVFSLWCDIQTINLFSITGTSFQTQHISKNGIVLIHTFSWKGSVDHPFSF